MLNLDEKIAHLTFSHTDCSDIWPAYFGEMQKFLPKSFPHYICVNSYHDAIPKNISPLIYNDSMSYPSRLLYCLKLLEEKGFEFILFDHEDMFLYEYPNFEELKKYYEILVTEQFDHIRFIKGGDCKSEPHPHCNSLHIFNLRSKWIFSIQPSFWKISTFKKILEANLNINVWQLEVKSQKIVKKLKLKAAFSHTNGKRRGMYHYDNSIYPYIATAIGKGKWNYSEYKAELNLIFDAYSIDPKTRGWN